MLIDFKMSFLGLGFARCGTTWLNEVLKEHPEICMPRERELSYFCTEPLWSTVCNYSRGKEWLVNKYSHAQNGQRLGEFNTIYISNPTSPQIIKNLCPDVKLLISYRNPTQRLYSMYYMLKRLYSMPDTFEAFLKKHQKYIESGYYYTLTKRFIDLFDISQFHFILLDDIDNNPSRTCKKLYEFLNVSPDFMPSCLDIKVNKARNSKITFLSNIVGELSEFLKNRSWGNRVHQTLEALGVHHVSRKLSDFNTVSSDIPPIQKATSKHLNAIYEKECRLLGDLLERDVCSLWSLSS